MDGSVRASSDPTVGPPPYFRGWELNLACFLATVLSFSVCSVAADFGEERSIVPVLCDAKCVPEFTKDFYFVWHGSEGNPHISSQDVELTILPNSKDAVLILCLCWLMIFTPLQKWKLPGFSSEDTAVLHRPDGHAAYWPLLRIQGVHLWG